MLAEYYDGIVGATGSRKKKRTFAQRKSSTALYSVRNNKVERTWGKLPTRSMLLGPGLVGSGGGYCGKAALLSPTC